MSVVLHFSLVSAVYFVRIEGVVSSPDGETMWQSSMSHMPVIVPSHDPSGWAEEERSATMLKMRITSNRTWEAWRLNPAG